MSGPLSGLRVLDFTRFVSGSYATMLLAALGAEVLKIEPAEGDPYRSQGAARIGDESALFLSLNSGKRSVVLDFRAEEGRSALEHLLESADFFVENARPGRLAAYGLDYDTLHRRHPSLVYGSISGYGEVGPDAGKGGFDLVLQAETGMMSVTGIDPCGPVKVGAPVLDIGAGLSCVIGLLAAHVERLASGVGARVSSSLFEFALASLSTVSADYLAAGTIPGLLGTHSPTFAPYGNFRTADGWLVLAGTGTEDLWRRACAALGCERLVADDRFRDNAARVDRRDELTAEIEAVLATATSDAWLERLDAAGVPATEVKNIAQVLTGSQAEALGMVRHLVHPKAGPYRVVGVPVRFDGAAVPMGPAPVLGADTWDVLTGARQAPPDAAAPDTDAPARPGVAGSSPEAVAAAVVDRTVELAAIPAPTGAESARAHRVAQWWQADGLADVTIDEAGNVWAVAVAGNGPSMVLAAHLDTVFPSDVDHAVRRQGSRLCGPGIGDDAVAVAALSAVGAMVAAGASPPPLRLLATVGEEGLGNLAGITWALDHPPGPLSALVAVEGNYLGRVGTIGVGSVRWRVVVSGPGGHAWEAAGAPSAVHEAARLVSALADVPTTSGRCSVNVGMLGGGEAVNARAREATFVVDVRAADPSALESLETRCREILAAAVPEGVSTEVREIGRRPAGQIDDGHPLVAVAVAALRGAGLPSDMVATSTDANAAHPRGVPAVALGVTTGDAEHTLGEWIEVDSIGVGLGVLADTVLGFSRERTHG